MSNLIIVTNRPPRRDEKTGKIIAEGGLVVGVGAAIDAMQNHVDGVKWVSCYDMGDPKNDFVDDLIPKGKIQNFYVGVDATTYKGYYEDFSNRLLWPAFHHMADNIGETGKSLSKYLAVNRSLAERIKEISKTDDILWVHDYHLAPLGKLLRENGTQFKKMEFFLHIPVPSLEFVRSDIDNIDAQKQISKVLNLLPFYDRVGLQTKADVNRLLRHFEINNRQLVQRFNAASYYHIGRDFELGAFPISVETQEIAETVARTSTNDVLNLKEVEGSINIVMLGRNDYMKGALEFYEGLNVFYKTNPEYVGVLSVTQIAPPSREMIKEYKQHAIKLKDRSSDLNYMYNLGSWEPITTIEKSVPRSDVLSFFNEKPRILVIPSLKDGMNLVAKEFIAAQNPDNPGVLILSKYAGASEELAEAGAIIIDPKDPKDIAEKLRYAAELMTPDNLHIRIEMQKKLFKVVEANNVANWSGTLLNNHINLSANLN